jgi:hypothetical protein
MARLGGREQLELSDLHLALNMAKMAKGGFPHTAIEESQYRIVRRCTKVREEETRGVLFPWRTLVNAVMEGQPAILHQNHTARCPPCQNGTAKNPQTCWRHQGPGVPLPN